MLQDISDYAAIAGVELPELWSLRWLLSSLFDLKQKADSSHPPALRPLPWSDETKLFFEDFRQKYGKINYAALKKVSPNTPDSIIDYVNYCADCAADMCADYDVMESFYQIIDGLSQRKL